MGLFYGKFFKNFWYEIVVVSVISFLLIFLFQFFVVAGAETSESLGYFIFISLVAVLLPLLPGFLGAYLASRKSEKLNAAIFVPAISIAIGTLIIIAFVFFATAEQLNDPLLLMDYDEFIAPETGLALEEFQSTTMFSLIPEMLTLLLSNFAVGILAGVIWRKQLCLRGKLKCEKTEV